MLSSRLLTIIRAKQCAVSSLCTLLVLSTGSLAAAQDDDLGEEEASDSANSNPSDAVKPLNDEAEAQSHKQADDSPKDAVPEAPPPAPAAPPTPPPASPLATPPVVKVGGGAIIYYRHSIRPLTEKPYKDVFEIYRGQVLIDGKLERFGLHFDFRVRDSLLKTFFKGTAWVEEAYATADLVTAESEYGPLVLKVGKIYQQFGRFWDNSFYGNIHLRDGLKIDPNFGLSMEGELLRAKSVGAKYFLQYFVVDGSTNSSNPARDTFAVPTPPGGVAPRRRNMAIGRIEPFLKLGDITVLKVGLSAEHFTASNLPGVGDKDVTRLGVDATVTVGPISVWGEYTKQNGQSTTEFPYATVAAVTTGMMPTPAIPGRAYTGADYLLIGGQLTYDRFAARYNFSQGHYLGVPAGAGFVGYEDYKENLQVPGVMVKAYDWLFLLVELALWESVSNVKGTVTLDKSINVTLQGKI
jgi:hypothetical protein